MMQSRKQKAESSEENGRLHVARPSLNDFKEQSEIFYCTLSRILKAEAAMGINCCHVTTSPLLPN